jgi:hypothetical protein
VGEFEYNMAILSQEYIRGGDAETLRGKLKVNTEER